MNIFKNFNNTNKIGLKNDNIKIDWWLVAIISFSFIIPSMGISNYFFFDEIQGLYKGYLYSGSMVELFKAAFYGNMGVGNDYRPLTNFVFGLQYKLWGDNPIGYQLVVALLFSIIALYIYLIGKLFKSRAVGIISSFAFMVFYHNFAATWYKGSAISGELMMSFILISFYNFLLWQRDNERKYFIICFITAILASFSKESILIYPPILFFYAILCQSGKSRIKGIYLSIIIGIVISIPFMITKVMRNSIPFVSGSGFSNGKGLYFWQFKIYIQEYIRFYSPYFLLPILITFLKRYKYYVIVLVLPFMQYQGYLSNKQSFFLPFIILLGMCFMFGNKYQRFAIVWFLLGFSFVLILTTVQSRYFIESSVGFSLFIGLGISEYLMLMKDLKNNLINLFTIEKINIM